MYQNFFEYNPISSKEIKELWTESIFVFDTNVLLNLYRYSPTTSSQFLSSIDKIKDRVWIPNQVGLEFHRNRIKVIMDQRKKYSDFEENFHKLLKEIENKRQSPFFSDELLSNFRNIQQDFNKEIKEASKKLFSKIKKDEILEKLNSIFVGNVGDSFEASELKNIYKEGEERYKTKIPPGYCDSKKPDNDKYGDLILWKQILKKAKDDNLNLMFVLDDEKEDWWLINQNITLSARPELVREFYDQTTKKIVFYRPVKFLEEWNNYFGKNIDDETIKEVENYREKENKNRINIHLKVKGNISSAKSFISFIEEIGYGISLPLSESEDIHNIHVSLPNIPDLKRRFTSKYLTKIDLYDLDIIEMTID
ncbi:PIN domain-containing protein [Bernardetia sp. Wsw4-3y2]|uniref:PIN-like domain-containing protein n=1 Tax=Bernardetia sp. Wsw4-3y2 TaxID=3127471 RepID=UPI0030D33197